MNRERKTVAQARSMMAVGNPIADGAFATAWQDQAGLEAMHRIMADGAMPGSAAGRAGARPATSEPAGASGPESGRQAPRLFRRGIPRRVLIPAAAAAAMLAVVVGLVLAGNLGPTRPSRPTPKVSGTVLPGTRRPVVTSTIDVGSRPFGVAVDARSRTIDVANAGFSGPDYGTLSVISARTRAVTATIDIEPAPFGVAVNQRTGTIYVANLLGTHPQGVPGHGSVSVISGRSSTLTGIVPVGSGPLGIAVDQRSGKVYVTNSRSNSVTVISSTTGKVLTTIAVGKAPYGVAVDSRTDTVYVSDLFGNAVSVINGRTDKVTGTIQVGREPFGIAVSPVNGDIYVTNSRSDSVSVISGATRKVIATTGVGRSPRAVAVDPRTGAIYVSAYRSGTVSVISPVTWKVTATVHVGSGLTGIAVDPVTGLVYVASQQNDTVTVLTP